MYEYPTKWPFPYFSGCWRLARYLQYLEIFSCLTNTMGLGFGTGKISDMHFLFLSYSLLWFQNQAYFFALMLGKLRSQSHFSCALTLIGRVPTWSLNAFSSLRLSEHREVTENRGHLYLYLCTHAWWGKELCPLDSWEPTLIPQMWTEPHEHQTPGTETTRKTSDVGHYPHLISQRSTAAVLRDVLNSFKVTIFTVTSPATRPLLVQMI